MSVPLTLAVSHTSGNAFGIPSLEERWHSNDRNYLRQSLADILLEPAIPVSRTEWVKVVSRFRKGMRVRPLRGLRVTMGIKEVLMVVASMSGKHGDRLFAHQRTIATKASYSVRHVRETLAIGVRTGLLVRHTHGAGGKHLPGAHKRQGASYQLTFPGGSDGITKFMQWLDNWQNARTKTRKNHPRKVKVRRANAEAEEFLSRNPDMTRLIAQALGTVPNREGAVNVIAEIFIRAKTRIVHQRQYILTAVEKEPELIEHYPPIEAAGGNAGLAKLASMLADIGKSARF